jgi:hypothetical protein
LWLGIRGGGDGTSHVLEARLIDMMHSARMIRGDPDMNMRHFLPSIIACLIATAHGETPNDQPAGKDACDFAAFLATAMEVEKIRTERMLSASEFADAMVKPGVIILDARGAEFYQKLRVKGAVNLPFTHFSVIALASIIPEKDTPVLIYCRNNLWDSPERRFETLPPSRPNAGASVKLPYPDEYEPPEIPKSGPAGLNIPVFVTLYSYGYVNVRVLNEVVDPNNSPIKFEGMHTPKP